mmetsp:Transcript_6896/g.25434  ORF Transcript_6896/g.25434 Transcript_6896/m.25434 type:complete len:261 (-) Transcript_6896:187-969(-)
MRWLCALQRARMNMLLRAPAPTLDPTHLETYSVHHCFDGLHRRTDVDEHGSRLRRMNGLTRVEVYDVVDYPAASIYVPIVPIEGKLIAERIQNAGLGRELASVALEPDKTRIRAFVAVQPLKGQHLVPAPLVDLIVDHHHGIHVPLARLPPLPSHRVVEHLGTRVLPIGRLSSLVLRALVVPCIRHGNAGGQALCRQWMALVLVPRLIANLGHLVQRANPVLPILQLCAQRRHPTGRARLQVARGLLPRMELLRDRARQT